MTRLICAVFLLAGCSAARDFARGAVAPELAEQREAITELARDGGGNLWTTLGVLGGGVAVALGGIGGAVKVAANGGVKK
jgi:hypothetical protein